jgi:phage baseplate assembly protein gpV
MAYEILNNWGYPSKNTSRMKKGRVIESLDPENEGRVHVELDFELPEDNRTFVWAHVLLSYASSADAGLHLFPEKDDVVMLASFLDGKREAHWVVLGSIYSKDKMVKINGKSGKDLSPENKVKAFKTKAGQQIVVSDASDKAGIYVQNSEGAKLHLDASKKVIELSDSASNTLKLSAQAKTVEIQAGTTKIELTSSGIKIQAGANKIDVSDSIALSCGGSKITVSPSSVTIDGATGISLGAMAIQGLIKAEFLALFNAHIHVTPMGPSGPPVPFASPMMATTKVKGQ